MFFQSFQGDGGVGGVSPNNRLYSQSYPSIYNSGAATGQAGVQNDNGEREREKFELEAEQGRQRSVIEDLEEECEDEEDEEEMDERRPYGHESAGEERVSSFVHLNALMCIHSEVFSLFASGVFSMDEDSLSRDCEPFFESDGEEESTDGKSLLC